MEGRRIPYIIIFIMPYNSSGDMPYTISDTYGRIYSTMDRILLDPTQDKIQALQHHIESEELTDASDFTTNSASNLTEYMIVYRTRVLYD